MASMGRVVVLNEEFQLTKKHFSVIALLLTFLSFPNLVNAGVCEIASKGLSKFGTGAAAFGVATGAVLKLAGIFAVPHSSGMLIASTASSGYVAGTLGAIGTATSVVTMPAVLIVGGVVVVAAGGTIAYCEYKKK